MTLLAENYYIHIKNSPLRNDNHYTHSISKPLWLHWTKYRTEDLKMSSESNLQARMVSWTIIACNIETTCNQSAALDFVYRVRSTGSSLVFGACRHSWPTDKRGTRYRPDDLRVERYDLPLRAIKTTAYKDALHREGGLTYLAGNEPHVASGLRAVRHCIGEFW